MPNEALTLERALPKNYLRSFALAFPLDWNAQRQYRLPSGDLGPYYVEWQPGTGVYGEDWTIAPRDADGVIMTAARSYHPVRIAQFGLHAHARFMESGDAQARSACIAQARWLAECQKVHRGIAGCYPYDFPNRHYGAPAGWISAMAQGEAVSLLLRAAALEHSRAFVDAALGAAEPFRHTVAEGGVVFRTPAGDAFLEEIVAWPASHILNGHIFALWGLLELQRAQPQAWLGELAAQATVTLRRRLPLYDSGYWSYYSLLGTRSGFRSVAVLKYHAFHIAQLRVTAALLQDAYFADAADRWHAYARSPACRARVIANTVARVGLRMAMRSDRVDHGAVDMLDRLEPRTAIEPH